MSAPFLCTRSISLPTHLKDQYPTPHSNQHRRVRSPAMIQPGHPLQQLIPPGNTHGDGVPAAVLGRLRSILTQLQQNIAPAAHLTDGREASSGIVNMVQRRKVPGPEHPFIPGDGDAGVGDGEFEVVEAEDCGSSWWRTSCRCRRRRGHVSPVRVSCRCAILPVLHRQLPSLIRHTAVDSRLRAEEHLDERSYFSVSAGQRMSIQFVEAEVCRNISAARVRQLSGSDR